MNSILRRFRALASDVVLLDGDQDDAPSLGSMAIEAARLLELTAERKGRKLPKVKAPGTPQSERAEAKWQHTETVKARVFKRDGCCVLCEGPIHDMHHLLYGSGNRTQGERVETCASVCRTHHDAAHDGDVGTLVQLVAWAWGLGYAEAARATERRIAKIRRVEIRVRRIAG